MLLLDRLRWASWLQTNDRTRAKQYHRATPIQITIPPYAYIKESSLSISAKLSKNERNRSIAARTVSAPTPIFCLNIGLSPLASWDPPVSRIECILAIVRYLAF
ncbi:1965_t:CDS:1 [Acaulospora colombiana]|uniref:1965_t:CDS:1 n=1 Tax=Acaulospora colombiana TaxID=27376 RepID=A0ACA9KK40_9GLOM|nr:1965_t:CDS:1 [Acaulospora colombiana]